MSYRIVNSGKNQRREYLGVNHSPLFQPLPERDYAQEQKKSYYSFLYNLYDENGKLLKPSQLSQLLNFYFPKEKPVEFGDYNNDVKINIEDVECREPEITVKDLKGKDITKFQSEKDAKTNSLT
jgi:hypothetical protein